MSQNLRACFEHLLSADAADDRACLALLLAETDEVFGLAADTAERRWARNARLLRRHVSGLGCISVNTDSGVGVDLLA